MNNFYCYNPTKILFGKGMIARIGNEIKDVQRVMVLYGQGSIRRNGVYDQVVNALGHTPFVEFGGIECNPEYETCMAAVELAKRHGVDFILAAGGGSVIDAAKFIALACCFDGDDPWKIITGEVPAPLRALPIGSIQTLPASGSEMNNAFVLSRRSMQSKLSYSAMCLYPRFSVLDPETALTLSRTQAALGLVDIFVHVLEQYITYPVHAPLQDRQAEAILHTVAEVGPALLERLDDYDLWSSVMWCGAQAVNGTLSRGVPTDWSTHMIGHEVTALYDIPHAQTLAIVLGGVYRHQIEGKQEKLAQYGRRIWGLSGSDVSVARASIDKTEAFFEGLGVPTRFSSLELDGEAVARSVRSNLAARNFKPAGERQAVDLDSVEAILMSRR